MKVTVTGTPCFALSPRWRTVRYALATATRRPFVAVTFSSFAASCVIQGLIPYGAQILIAIGVAKGLDMAIDSFSLLKCLYYQPLLALAVFVSMFVGRKTR